MKLGAENRKEVIALAVLGLVAAVMLGRSLLFRSDSSVSQATSLPSTDATRTGVRRTTSGKIVKAAPPRLDPTLELDLLRQSEEIKYEGSNRNIFVAGSIAIPAPKATGATDHPTPVFTPPAIPPPPPITLKFFGFASKPGEPKKVFLSQGEDVWIAGEGDIVNRRYRVLHISPASVDVEDVLNNNRASLPLTQG